VAQATSQLRKKILHKNKKNTQKRNIKKKQNKDNKYNDIKTNYKEINKLIN